MIFDLPDIPSSLKFSGDMTPEQKVILKCLKLENLSKEEELVLKESITFYKKAFPLLQGINLSKISDGEVEELKKYLDNIFKFIILITNDIHFIYLFRVSFVRDDFTEKGKVRTPAFLTYPPVEIVKKMGCYNRASSDKTTVFYGSFYENVSIREAKPQVGDRIIISTWENITGKPFVSYPITNAEVDNENVIKATQAFEKTKMANNPLFSEIMDLYLSFLASEFVKDAPVTSERRYEYLYGAYFADMLFLPTKEKTDTPEYDFILYPSVAWKHKHVNVAVTPSSVDSKLKLVKAIEYDVLETYYDVELEKTAMPAKLKFIRDADWIEDDLIIWNDE